MKRMIFVMSAALIAFALCGRTQCFAQGRSKSKGGFMNHGVPAPVSECRGVIAAADGQGNPIILATAMDMYKGKTRTSLLLINARTGETQQFWYPKREAANGTNFHLMLAATGKLYVPMGYTFLEFDPNLRKWTFAKKLQSRPWAMTEDSDGTIYLTGYQTTHLLAFNPKTRELKKLCRLDPAEKYPSYIAVDSAGWVYVGIGTARSNLVAFNPKTKERRQLVKESERKVGSGYVHKGRDGHVYGCFSYRKPPWFRLSKGKAEPVKTPSPKALTRCIGWSKTYSSFPDGGKLATFDMPGKSFEVVSPEKETNVVTFDYVSGGAAMRSLITGSDGKLYGSTCHPMWFFAYDPKTDKLVSHGGLKKVGGGNFRGLAVLDNTVFGTAYAGGRLYAFDTTRPWKDSGNGDKNANPRFLTNYRPDLTTPCTLLAHPDKRHIITAGYPGYGRTGGGMGFYDLETGKSTVLTHKEILPGHSTVTLKALRDGNLVGGTSILGSHGGHTVARTGKLYIMDYSTRRVVFHMEPVPGARDVTCIVVGPRGKVFGITNTSQLFVFDPKEKKVIHRADLKEFGEPHQPDKTLTLGPDNFIYGVLSRSILRINTKTYKHRKLAAVPVRATTGIAICKGRLYYAAGPELWSYRLGKR